MCQSRVSVNFWVCNYLICFLFLNSAVCKAPKVRV